MMNPEPMPFQVPPTNKEGLNDDLLEGAAQIAKFLYGNGNYKHRRKIYHLAQSSRLPVFRLGTMLCARRSTLKDFIEDQEQKTRKAHDATYGGMSENLRGEPMSPQTPSDQGIA